MDKLKVTRVMTKAVVTGIVGASVSFTVNHVLKNNMTEVEKRREKAELAIGSAVIGGLVADRARAKTNASVDQLFDALEKIRDWKIATPKEVE